MKKIAIIPFHDGLDNNRLFESSDSESHHDNLMLPYKIIKEDLESLGYTVNTIDLIADYKEIDVVLFFRPDFKYLLKLKNSEAKLLYFAWEPEVVDSKNSINGLRNLSKYFDAIFTWNDDVIDNKTYFKINYPYYFENKIKINIPSCQEFEKKKQLVNISGNKFSLHKDELYSSRWKVISFYNRHYPDEFELYGKNWPSIVTYKGSCDSKSEIYKNFKFALCLENMHNIKGYVTEKIFDCFTSGIVPIYLGASNINHYIPRNCYISYNFKSVSELREHINSISLEEYQQYLKNIQLFLNEGNLRTFKADYFVEEINNYINSNNCLHNRRINENVIKVRIFYNSIKKYPKALFNKSYTLIKNILIQI